MGEVSDDSPPPPRLRPNDDRPLVRLSVDILLTFKTINRRFFQRRRERRHRNGEGTNNGYDDANGSYEVIVGEEIADRYLVQSLLGCGMYGVVVQAFDQLEEQLVAIKIVRRKQTFTTQAQSEIAILRHLATHGDPDRDCFVRLIDTFTWQHHTCLVFELLSLNLYDLLKCHNFDGLTLPCVRVIARQILHCLAFVSRKDVGIVHCDLKPENIVLTNATTSRVKVIDFGSSTLARRCSNFYIQSRYYRSPEVITGHPYGPPIDMWSLGCVLYEVHTGTPLFSGRSEAQQLERFASVLGPIPSSIVDVAACTTKDLLRAAQPGAPPTPPVLKANAYAHNDGDGGARLLMHALNGHGGGPGQKRAGDAAHSSAAYADFVSLLVAMLRYDPADRIKPADALRHPFIAADAAAPAAVPAGMGGAPAAASAAAPAAAAGGAAASSAAHATAQSTLGGVRAATGADAASSADLAGATRRADASAAAPAPGAPAAQRVPPHAAPAAPSGAGAQASPPTHPQTAFAGDAAALRSPTHAIFDPTAQQPPAAGGGQPTLGAGHGAALHLQSQAAPGHSAPAASGAYGGMRLDASQSPPAAPAPHPQSGGSPVRVALQAGGGGVAPPQRDTRPPHSPTFARATAE